MRLQGKVESSEDVYTNKAGTEVAIPTGMQDLGLSLEDLKDCNVQPPGSRIGDTIRDSALTQIQQAHATGHLNLAEFQARLAAVEKSTKESHVTALTQDLPPVVYTPKGVTKAQQRWNDVPVAAKAAALSGGSLTACAFLIATGVTLGSGVAAVMLATVGCLIGLILGLIVPIVWCVNEYD